jgi:uncharacterized damage-inducible protein DinB
MQTKPFIALACLASASLLFSCSQPAPQEAAAPSTSRVNAMVADWQRAKKFTQAYLDSADEKTVAYKLSEKTPRSFGAQLLHLAEGNYGLVKAGGGNATDMGFGTLEGKSEYATKAAVAEAVNASYDYVIASLGTLNDNQLMDTVKVELFPGMNVAMTKEAFYNKAFEHQTHHRGQATQYLRSQGKTPPQEMLF